MINHCQLWRPYPESLSEPLVAAGRALYEHTRAAGDGAWVYWGQGRRPSMTAQIPVGSLTIQPWSFYTEGAPGGGPVLAVNFEWIYKGGRGLDEAALDAFADRLRTVAAVAPHIEPARAAGWRKRPSIPAELLFREPQAISALTAALEQLYALARGGAAAYASEDASQAIDEPLPPT
jgi:hypothetical protein